MKLETLREVLNMNENDEIRLTNLERNKLLTNVYYLTVEVVKAVSKE